MSRYCPIRKLCSSYQGEYGCGMFSDGKWYRCETYKEISNFVRDVIGKVHEEAEEEIDDFDYESFKDYRGEYEWAK